MFAPPMRALPLAFAALILIFGCHKKDDQEAKKTGSNPAQAQAQAQAQKESQKIPEAKSADAPREPKPAPLFSRPIDAELRQRPVPEQQAYLLALLKAQESLSPAQEKSVGEIFAASEWLGFGNPKMAQPGLSQEECRARIAEKPPQKGDASCGHPNMVRISGGLCIDQYEFPNALCEYPVVWVRASEAAALCGALGKRLCDAHEWEGACAGEVRAPEEEYSWAKLPKGEGREYRRARRMLMEGWHNTGRKETWAYGDKKDHSRCGTSAKKSPECQVVDFGICGTNDFPAGSFPECVSEAGVYDQHGNAAEHMSLPLYPDEIGGKGYTEMKGSWFLFAREETHPDDCRWRAKNWHTTKIADDNSHRNYHLGFRCCADTQ